MAPFTEAAALMGKPLSWACAEPINTADKKLMARKVFDFDLNKDVNRIMRLDLSKNEPQW
jgi:hypothetical protein